MADLTGNFEDKIQNWATGSDTGGEGDSVVSDAEIRTYLDNQVSGFGTLYTDELLIPEGASQRSQLFTDEVDMFRHWVSSGLLYFDENDDIIQNPMIHILRYHDDVLDQDVYQVWVDDDTG